MWFKQRVVDDVPPSPPQSHQTDVPPLRFLVRVQTEDGPRTYVTQEFSPRDASLMRASWAACGAVVAPVPPGPVMSVAAILKARRTAAKRRAKLDSKVVQLRESRR